MDGHSSSPVERSWRDTGKGKLPLQAKTNYLIGRDTSQWIRNVPTFGEVAYDEIYPGVNLLFYGSKDHLEHDFVVSPHSDPSVIRFELAGAEQLELSDSGDLVASAVGEKVIFQKPTAYQEIDGKRIKVDSAFHLDNSQPASRRVISFQLGRYDSERQLIIDSVFSFSTYLTGTGLDEVTAVTTDATGNIYLTGFTSSSDFPTQNGEQPQLGCIASAPTGCQNAFITKLDSTGHTLLYSTYLGGSSRDYGGAIAVDTTGNVIIAGVSESSNFPHAGAVPTLSCQTNNNCYFLASLKPDGSALNYSGQIGGSEGAYTNGTNGRLAVDASGNAYLAGITDSPNFQLTSGTLVPSVTGYPYISTFVLEVDPTGKLLYSTAIPGNAAPNPSASFNNFFLPTGIAVDSSRQAIVSGTGGPGLPTTARVVADAFPNKVTNVANPIAGYVLQLNATASAINYGTYVPGTDTLGGMAVDNSGNLYLTGSTSETTLPVSATAYQKALSAGQNCTCNDGFYRES
jgi:Beta-propeller repeat